MFMRQASLMLGILTLLMIVGAYLAFHEKAEAPVLGEVTRTELSTTSTMLMLTSTAFEAGGLIPSQYTCDGENVSPELRIENVPEGTQSFVLVMDDPDIPDAVKQSRGIEKFDHWTIYNIPGDTTLIPQGAVVGTGGKNSRGTLTYTGPCPPDREHRYIFRLYALPQTLSFDTPPTLDALEQRAKDLMIESATLIGRYNRIENTQLKTKN